MDHRISKDMISSGMIPSGEKNQEDLGKTQYGTVPSPNALSDVYKKMYGVDESMDPMDFGKSKRTEEEKEKSRNLQSRLGNKKTQAQRKDQLKGTQIKTDSTDSTPKSTPPSKGFGESSLDLLAVYNAVYEHHKKDADGNTIPHEGEEINEILGMGAIASAGKALLTNIGKTAIGSQVKNIGKKVVKDFKKNPLDTAVKASVVANSIPKPGMPNVPAVEKPKSQGGMRSTQYASADLFDIVKGQLLDEGLSEEEIKDIMLTLTPDEILSEMGMATPESGTGKYYNEKNPTDKQKEIQKNLPQNKKPTQEQQAARDKYAKIKDMTNKGDHQGASKLYNS